jgi:Subtilase family
MSEDEPRVIAHVILHSASGKPVISNKAKILPSNVEKFFPREKTFVQATSRLKNLQFKIDFIHKTHITISGSRDLFQDVFKVKLELKSLRQKRYYGENKGQQSYYQSVPEPTIPSELSDFIEALEFPKPVSVYIGPSPTPPPVSYYHIDVPFNIARKMGCVKTHRRPITGKGIKACLVDTGFMEPHHPYYAAHKYRNIQPVIADPADPNPGCDSGFAYSGHGTAIAACLLAVAPETILVPVKFFGNNTTDAFSRAVQQGPHLITCSWGLDPPTKADTALQLAINDAIASGIVVVFACGNKNPYTGKALVGWPSSEPGVISAGGVCIDENNLIEAATFASSGINPNNPGRQCPDFCGLCGMTPYGLYIRLPTQPGSWIDKALSGIDETSPDDGWVVASGTSCSAPMIAGVVALLLEKKKKLIGKPAAVREALIRSCVDVIKGKSGSGEPAGPGRDLATGEGLVQGDRGLFVRGS